MGDDDDEPLLTCSLGPGKVPVVTRGEYRRICAAIQRRPELVADALDFKERWEVVNRQADELGFAELPERMPEFHAIVRAEVKNGLAEYLVADVLREYLVLK